MMKLRALLAPFISLLVLVKSTPLEAMTTSPPSAILILSLQAISATANFELFKAGNNGSPISAFPLGMCEGDCDNDSECQPGLRCFQRDGTTEVPGCSGAGLSGNDYCHVQLAGVLQKYGDEAHVAFPLGICEGDCDSDVDCKAGLICFQRSDAEAVPGCQGSGGNTEDYCYSKAPNPVPNPILTDKGNNGSPSSEYPLGLCEGDCDNDDECEDGLRCFQRDGLLPVPGCGGTGSKGMDYCHVQQAGVLQKYGMNNNPNTTFPLHICEGDCDTDSDCKGGLKCFQRLDTEGVPGCQGSGASTVDYCYSEVSPVPLGTISYYPGDLTVSCQGLTLSTGLACDRLTTGGQPVLYTDGSSGSSTDTFHSLADGATVIPHPTDGGWYYVSNSEASPYGGVGAIRFNADGDVIGFKKLLSGTQRNCGGGKTSWNTWVTCEEDGRVEWGRAGGWCWEVDPYTEFTQPTGVTGQVSGNYESMAYDDQDPDVDARFFITEDAGNGQLTRYTPCASSFNTNSNYDILSNQTCAGTTDYLVVTEGSTANGITYGTFIWTSDLAAGRNSASDHFRQCEGIDIKNRMLYMTCKANKQLFILDLAAGTYEESSTVSGAFNNQPDQVARILANDNDPDQLLYFCEDGGGDCDIHARDANGNYFTVITGDGFATETTGLSFSPDGKYMYFALQGPSAIFKIWRSDGYPFHGDVVDIKYHTVANIFRIAVGTR